jgi:hypothetical protein
VKRSLLDITFLLNQYNNHILQLLLGMLLLSLLVIEFGAPGFGGRFIG